MLSCVGNQCKSIDQFRFRHSHDSRLLSSYRHHWRLHMCPSSVCVATWSHCGSQDKCKTTYLRLAYGSRELNLHDSRWDEPFSFFYDLETYLHRSLAAKQSHQSSKESLTGRLWTSNNRVFVVQRHHYYPHPSLSTQTHHTSLSVGHNTNRANANHLRQGSVGRLSSLCLSLCQSPQRCVYDS